VALLRLPRRREAAPRFDDDGNLVARHARRVRADEADTFVLDAPRTFRLRDSAIEDVRAQLERRRKAHRPGDIDRQRERLEGMLAPGSAVRLGRDRGG
jgi:hypothetical protein